MNSTDCVAFLQWALPQLRLSWHGFRKVRSQVCKRIRRRMETLGLEDFAAYRDHLERHRHEWAVLDGFCRITISRFWRDRNVFRLLGDRVLPPLAQRAAQERRGVTCWSAGCASGEEVYTLRILWDLTLADAYLGVALTLLGTDVDEAVLARASAGCYQSGSVKEMPSGWIERCFERRGDLLCVKAARRFVPQAGYQTGHARRTVRPRSLPQSRAYLLRAVAADAGHARPCCAPEMRRLSRHRRA